MGDQFELTLSPKVVEGEVKFENDEHKNQYEGLPDEVSCTFSFIPVNCEFPNNGLQVWDGQNQD